MERIRSVISTAISYMKTAQASDIVDILLVAVLIYVAIGLIRRTNMTRVARGIVLIILALWMSDLLKLRMINSFLKTTVELGFIALVIIFQPELRRLLERMGSGRFMSFGRRFDASDVRVHNKPDGAGLYLDVGVEDRRAHSV